MVRRLCFVLALLLAGRASRAADPRETARAHYARGLALAAQNGYDAALREFTEAYAIRPQFAVLYNIGQAHVALGHSVEAIAALSKYLHDGRDRLPPGRRQQVQAQITSLVAALDTSSNGESAAADGGGVEPLASVNPLQPAVAETGGRWVTPTTLAVRCAEPGVKIALDGKPVDPPSASRGLSVTPGIHRLSLTTAGRRAADQTLEVAGGSTAVVICQSLSPVTAGAEPRVGFDGPPVLSLLRTAAPPPSQPIDIHPSTVGFALGGVGLALEGGALGLYLWNRNRAEQANAERRSLMQNPNADGHFDDVIAFNQRVDSIHTINIATVGLAVAGGVALAGGIYLWQRERTQTTSSPSPPSGTSGVAVALAPGSAGVAWTGTW